ncbi:hypothetical protein BDM02DRAFT_3121640 [Thelephora ganbajun]|uniref:Uncharacterized protein n=1 Tax=Thelephora ganbajun TaxID=370292 RepID=A0ACB6Z5D5_THEGA|nr:hypothetical protein BDM02DRAFT_3121640 [Thelephora ganbajun]
MSTAKFPSELASALKENSFGLKSYQVVRETQLESIATIVLLEGETITVSSSPQGFEVLCKETETIHETLEQLLDSLSPAYRLASQQALFSRLEEFATAHEDRGNRPADTTARDG